jgi:hypothetical protein
LIVEVEEDSSQVKDDVADGLHSSEANR